MKKMATIKAALTAVRTGCATSCSAKHEVGEVIFTGCFTSGHVFYTCRMFGIIFDGILHPKDTFDLYAVKPKTFGCMDGWGGHSNWVHSNWVHSNWVAYSEESKHEACHERLVQRLLDKSCTFCPGRLRKFRAK